ncbi:hypothetical protein BD410DRAFT_892730 [Rickenella mellea]|uniref:RRM domain-containing protein n=1 Tax=Rickenella mellea TaxID=50990 RepID=A0A4V3AZK2_9AGAM|nr:hypothetical protein BD410DRAFT_892730 [Rickenella mellea]
MSDRGRSSTPRPLNDTDVDMENGTQDDKPDAKVVIVTHLTRNVVESHLQAIFGFYGDIVKIDLPLFGKSGQNRGKAALEYVDAASAHKAAHHMNGGQLDSSFLKVELSDLPIRGTRSRSRSVSPRPRAVVV